MTSPLREADAKLPKHEFVYLVLAHGHSPQLARLMQTIRLGSPNSAILLHHDAKSMAPDETVLQRLGVRLVTPRISPSWGDFSLVNAMLNSISFALKNIDFDWLVILSGQDYPLRPFPKLESELRDSTFDAFVKAAAVSNSAYGYRYYMRYWALPKMRYAHRFPKSMRKTLDWAQAKLNQSNTWLRIQPGPRNSPTRLGIKSLGHPFSSTFACYKGSQWLTLSKRAAVYLVQFGHERPDILSHYRRTLIPDESYFQSVLCNAKDLHVCNDHRRFILWDETKPAHPVTLSMQHFDAMISSGKDFGRKFDSNVNAEVLDRLDEVVIGPQQTTTN